jgi:hypothetical protein
MDDYPKIVGSRENSSMVSTWTEYLRLSVIGRATALLEVCRYEALAEAPDCGDGDEEPVLPEEIDGKKVAGIEDEWIIGGDLLCYDDKQRLFFDKNDIEAAVQWLTDNRWQVTSELAYELRKAAGT